MSEVYNNRQALEGPVLQDHLSTYTHATSDAGHKKLVGNDDPINSRKYDETCSRYFSSSRCTDHPVIFPTYDNPVTCPTTVVTEDHVRMLLDDHLFDRAGRVATILSFDGYDVLRVLRIAALRQHGSY